MSETMAEARCPECGAQEPSWDARFADPDNLRAELTRLQAERERLRDALHGIERCALATPYRPDGTIDNIVRYARAALSDEAKETTE